LETGEQTVYAEGRDIQDLAFSPDGEVITVVDGEHDHEGSIYDIDPSTGETVSCTPTPPHTAMSPTPPRVNTSPPPARWEPPRSGTPKPGRRCSTSSPGTVPTDEASTWPGTGRCSSPTRKAPFTTTSSKAVRTVGFSLPKRKNPTGTSWSSSTTPWPIGCTPSTWRTSPGMTAPTPPPSRSGNSVTIPRPPPRRSNHEAKNSPCTCRFTPKVRSSARPTSTGRSS